MRPGWRVVFAAALALVPSPALAQADVVFPAPGAESSYRRTTIAWLPIPGAGSYHLQVDDDPAFGSPEVDVIVAAPAYTLRGEQLRLNGELSWAAYVRIDGNRWRLPAFTPSYLPDAFWPEIAVDFTGTVHYAYLGGRSPGARAFFRSSADWSDVRQLSPPGTDGNPHDLALEVDPVGIAHAFWTEQVSGRVGIPHYANSVAWTASAIGEQVGGLFDLAPVLLITGSAIEIFEEQFGPVQRFTSTDGVTFTRTSVPNSSNTSTVDGALDPSGAIVLVERRHDGQIYIQTSADDWASSQPIGTGEYPSIAIGADGVRHVVKRESGFASYSNSARAFASWTPLPIPQVIGQQLLPITVDDAAGLIYTAAPAADGTRVCVSAAGGEVWWCERLGGSSGSHPDLKIDAEGVLHVAWADLNGGGYANSLGSFRATNFSPDARFAAAVHAPDNVFIDTTVEDADGDFVAGWVGVGTLADQDTVVKSGESFVVLGEQIWFGGGVLYTSASRLQFRFPGGEWGITFPLHDGIAFPVQVEVRTRDRRFTDSFTILQWRRLLDVTIRRSIFTPYTGWFFIAPWMPSLGLTFTPLGPLTLRVVATDWSSVRVYDTTFNRSPGQNRLVLRR